MAVLNAQRVCALVPIKENSERVPGKNFRSIGGFPLYHHILSTLISCDTVDEVLVDTDSDYLISVLGEEFPSVRTRRRSDRLGFSSASMDEVLREAVPFVRSETVIQLHVTNPFLTSATIDAAVDNFRNADSVGTLISADVIRSRLWSHDSLPINHDPRVMERTQDMLPVYKENSCFFIFRKELMLEAGVRCVAPFRFFGVSALESLDIDTEADFAFASQLFSAGISSGLEL